MDNPQAASSDFTAQKILGIIILILGLALIFYAIYSSFNIFTGKTLPPQIFTVSESKAGAPSGTNSVQDQAQRLIQESIRQQFQTVLPSDILPKTLNLLSWSFFAWILIFGGVQVSGLGIRLLKR